MPGSMNIQRGTAAQSVAGQATLRPTIDSEQQVEFASSARDAVWLAFAAAAFSPAAMYAKAPVWRWVVGGVVVFLAFAAVRRGMWRERLSLDLMQRRYTYSRGYWPHLTSDEGRLDTLKGVALDAVVGSGSEGGKVITWVVSLAFADRILAVANFNTELAGYQYLGSLAKRLRVAALDHTGNAEERTAYTEIDKPLAAQTGRAAPRRQFPPLPDGSRIALRGDMPERRIVLPRPGFRPSYFGYALFPLFPAWFTGTLHDLHLSAPFVAVAGLLAVVAAIACVTNKEVAEAGDSISVATRLFGASLGTRTIAKRDVVEVRLKPVPRQAWRKREEIQVRATGALLNLTVAALSHDEMAWLAQAMQAMVAAA
jgi:hypothetical protein